MCLFSREAVPSSISMVSVKTFAVSIFCFQWIACFMFILTDSRAYVALGIIILIGSLVFYLMFRFKYKRLFELMVGAQNQILLENPYQHPLERKEEPSPTEIEA